MQWALNELEAQGSNDCAPDTKRLPRKIRPRDEKMCPMDKLQLNNGEETGRPASPLGPNAQQGGSRQNSGGQPKPRPRLLIPQGWWNVICTYSYIEAYEMPKPNSENFPEEANRRIRFRIVYPNPTDSTIEPCHFYTFSALNFFQWWNPKMSIDAEVFLYADIPPLDCLDDRFG